MPYGLYISAEGAQAQSRRLEVLANNLANVDTVGFKRELAVIQSRYAEAIEQGTVSPGAGSIDDLGGGVRLQQTATDFSAGPLKRTELPTDVALPGEGFFVVRRGEETFLTRAGNFRLTASGELVTQQGYQVLSENSTPVSVLPGNGPWHINPTGAMVQAGSAQNLAMVEPNSLSELVKVGENLFRATGETHPLAANNRTVAPGYVEASGVQPTTEMTALVETSRLLEANLNVMKAQDQMLGGLIGRILKV